MTKEMACRKCRCITIVKICGNCNSTDLLPNWTDIALVADPANSQIARSLGIKKKVSMQ